MSLNLDAVPIYLVGEVLARGADDHSLRSTTGQRAFTRIRRGAYAHSSALATADDDTRYALRIAAVLGTRRSPIVLSHVSAARVWGIPIASTWPWEVHATVHPASQRRTKNGVICHRHQLRADEVVERDGILLTSVVRTLIDVARSSPFRDGVAAVDAALRSAMVDRNALLGSLDALGDLRGRVAARRAIAFASPLAQLPGESFSRALIHEIGFPPAVLQQEFRVTSGVRKVDFWWNEAGVVGEFDGRGKYADAALMGGLDATAVVFAEKHRENELLETGSVRRVVRWTWAELEQVHPLVRRLEAAGLRRRRPRGYSARSALR